MRRASVRRIFPLLAWLLSLWILATAGGSVHAAARVYVVLWFDTEDYLLPASDDAALHVADFLTKEQVRATFKVVGEKARTLERRGRVDVIAALKKHEIGFHSNYHSVQPSPAMYLSTLGWDEGVTEFDRRERPGFDDVKRIFGVAPSCYGQPGSSWGPQVFGAMRRWGMPVYLDAGSHVALNDHPFYYGGILNLYKLEHQLRTGLANPAELDEAIQKFTASRTKLLAEGGGVVSIYYHPCEFVHRQFWDGVNFRNGANPPREKWQIPPAKTPEESQIAYRNFEGYIRFIKRFEDVQFITAIEAAALYADAAQGHRFTRAELREIAAAVKPEVTYQVWGNLSLSASDVFALLNDYVAERTQGRTPDSLRLAGTPDGATQRSQGMAAEASTDWSQFSRTALDVADFLRRQGRIPTTVWLGSLPVAPESYLQMLATVAKELLDGKEPPQTIAVPAARLAVAAHVSEDGPHLWGWIIFPRGFRAHAMMELAKQEAWTLKPALLKADAGGH